MILGDNLASHFSEKKQPEDNDVKTDNSIISGEEDNNNNNNNNNNCLKSNIQKVQWTIINDIHI